MNNRSARRRARQRRNVLMTVALMLVVALVSVGGTIAWLQDSTSEVKNTFSPSNIKLTLEETTGTDYQMVPGSTITKDPEVTVKAGSEAAWVFVEITASTSPDFADYMEDVVVADGWTLLNETDTDNDTVKDKWVYWRTVDKSTSDQPFAVLKDNKLTVKTSVTKAMMEAIDGVDANGAANTTETKPTLTFKAYAIQQANIATDKTAAADKALVAWQTINPGN